MQQLKLDPIHEVISDFRQGRMLIMVDDQDRENEGDLVVATELLTEEHVAFMLREARGLTCVSISAECAARLSIPYQVNRNNSPFNTPFGTSLDHRSVATQGVSAASRAKTMRELVNPAASAEDFVFPGHCFPLIANSKGVLGRRGQTEGSYDLARLAGLSASAVICEILNADGSMARGAALEAFAAKHALKITSVEQLARYRLSADTLIRNTAEGEVQTDFGPFRAFVFEDDASDKEHLALVLGDLSSLAACVSPTLLRIHSECLTGDVFESRRCDCGQQLNDAMRMIKKEGQGLILYLRQEGRGIGLSNKLRAYNLQDQGHDTVEANLKLGFGPDERDFAVAARILEFFGIEQVRLLTNNPHKIEALKLHGIEVKERVALVAKPDELSSAYLSTKRSKMGHWI